MWHLLEKVRFRERERSLEMVRLRKMTMFAEMNDVVEVEDGLLKM